MDYSIGCAMFISLSPCRAWTKCIGHGMCTSLSSFEIYLRALPLSCVQWLADVIRGIPASVVVYIFLSDASRGLLASVGLLHIALSLIGMHGPHRPMLANSVRRHYAFPSPIAFGMYNIQPTSSVAFPH